MSGLWTRLRRLTPRPGLRSASLVLAATIVIGWLFVVFFVSFGEGLERRALLDTATVAATTIDGAGIAKLAGSAAHLNTREYTQAREALARIRAAVPDARFVYLLGQRAGYIIFLMDSEAASSPDHSLPGEVYTAASPALRLVFHTVTAVT